MEDNFDIDVAKEALEKQLKEMGNVQYEDWDSLQITLVKDDVALTNIRMMRQDMEAMANLHGTERSHVIEMMIQALEEEHKNK
jgi:hypothetical protein